MRKFILCTAVIAALSLEVSSILVHSKKQTGLSQL